MERKTIAIDMDNVIADLTTHYLQWYERDFGKRIDPQSIQGVPELEALPDKVLKKYVYQPTFFRTVPVMKGAPQALEKLQQHFDVYIVSAATEYPQSMLEKYEWLQEHFPFIPWQNMVFCGSKCIINTDYMIDDYVRNLKTCKGKPFLYTAPHNVNVKGYDRINNWEEAITIFNKEKNEH